MRVLVGALVLGCCAWGNHTRSVDWRTDQALWSAAHRTAPGLARPVFNLAIAEEHSGQWELAADHVLLARRLYSADPSMPLSIGRALATIDTLGQTGVCDRPSVQPLCVWD